MLSGRSPGVQGAAATGRPLCAPCATGNILQKNELGAQSPRILPEIIPAEEFRSLSIRRKCPTLPGERVKEKKTVFPFILVILQAACAFIADPAEEFRSLSIRRTYLTLPGERVKGKKTVFPLTIPAVPQRNRCCALRSPPGPQPAVGSTRRDSSLPWDSPLRGSAGAVQNCSGQFCPVSIRLWPPSLAASPRLPTFGSPISAGTRASLGVLWFQRN